MIEVIIRAPAQALVLRSGAQSRFRRITAHSRVVAIPNVDPPYPGQGQLDYSVPGNPLFETV